MDDSKYSVRVCQERISRNRGVSVLEHVQNPALLEQ